MIADDDCEDILFKYNILFNKGRKFTIPELREHIIEKRKIGDMRPIDRKEEHRLCEEFIDLAERTFLR